MPRKYKKRKYSRKRRRRGGYNMIKSTRSPISRSMLTKMRYVTTGQLDPSSSTPSSLLYRANDIYDPEVAVGGHQALGFDQFIGVLYDHFIVLGSRIKVDFISADAGSTTGAVRCGINLSDSNAPVVTYNTIIEQGDCTSGIMTNAGALSKKTLYKNFSTKKFFNRADVKDCSELRGSSAGSPTEQCYFNVFAEGINPVVNPTALDVQVTIEYIVLLQEPKQLAQS